MPPLKSVLGCGRAAHDDVCVAGAQLTCDGKVTVVNEKALLAAPPLVTVTVRAERRTYRCHTRRRSGQQQQR